MQILRKSFIVNVPEGADADIYISCDLSSFIQDNDIFEECIINIIENKIDELHKITLYYRKER